MCGIFGVVYYGSEPLTLLMQQMVKDVTTKLLLNSEIRGREASGVAVVSGLTLSMLRQGISPSRLSKTDKYQQTMEKINNDFKAVIGHTRAPTQGSPFNNLNNHPIPANNVIGVHNGVIYNDYSLFRDYKDRIDRSAEVDSEIIFRLLDMFLKEEPTTVVEAVKKTSKLLNGSFAVAFFTLTRPNYLTIFKKWSPVEFLLVPELRLIVFASTVYILNKSVDETAIQSHTSTKQTLGELSGVRISLNDGTVFKFSLPESEGNRRMSWRDSYHSYANAGEHISLPAPRDTDKTSTINEDRLRRFISKFGVTK